MNVHYFLAIRILLPCTYYNFMYVGSVDYKSGPYAVIFSTGMTTALLNITIVNDNILERNESFNLFIATDSLPSKIADVTIAQARVTIIDNDSKYLCIVEQYIAMYTVNKIFQMITYYV